MFQVTLVCFPGRRIPDSGVMAEAGAGSLKSQTRTFASAGKGNPCACPKALPCNTRCPNLTKSIGAGVRGVSKTELRALLQWQDVEIAGLSFPGGGAVTRHRSHDPWRCPCARSLTRAATIRLTSPHIPGDTGGPRRGGAGRLRPGGRRPLSRGPPEGGDRRQPGTARCSCVPVLVVRSCF